jgi:Holliday junction resolvase RusA-like endonuclease
MRDGIDLATRVARAPARSVTLKLPLPPSANGLFVNGRQGRGRFISPEYNQWQWSAYAALTQQWPFERITGAFHFRLTVPQNMRGDVDNRIKAALDFCVVHKITPDDRHAQSVSAERGDVEPGFAIIKIDEVLP